VLPLVKGRVMINRTRRDRGITGQKGFGGKRRKEIETRKDEKAGDDEKVIGTVCQTQKGKHKPSKKIPKNGL